MIIWRTLLDFVAVFGAKLQNIQNSHFSLLGEMHLERSCRFTGAPRRAARIRQFIRLRQPRQAAADPQIRCLEVLQKQKFSTDFFGSKSSKRCEQEASCLLNRFKKNMNAKTVSSAICFCNGGEIFHEFLSEFIGSISGLERSRQPHLALLCESSCGQGAFAQPFMRCLATSGRFPMVLRTRYGSILECSDQREQRINGTSETSCARS